jgi:hypothetical protein
MDPYQQQMLEVQKQQMNIQRQRQVMDATGGSMNMFGQMPQGHMPSPLQMHLQIHAGHSSFPMQMQQNQHAGGMMFQDSSFLTTQRQGSHMPMLASMDTSQYGYYGPSPQQQMNHMERNMDQSSCSSSHGKRHAPQGQWKTPPHQLYMKSKAKNAASKAKSPPRSGMQRLSFQENNNHMMPNMQTTMSFLESSPFSAASAPTTPGSATCYNPNSNISLDPALLAKMTGKKSNEITPEQIHNMMQHPELLTIYQKLQEEEAKRLKRLERNRASAARRREKKKGLVETYEGEVSELESLLAKVKSHTFGDGSDKLLMEALGGTKIRHSI